MGNFPEIRGGRPVWVLCVLFFAFCMGTGACQGAPASREAALEKASSPLFTPAEPSSWESTRRYLLIRSLIKQRGFSSCFERLSPSEPSSPKARADVKIPCFTESVQPWNRITKEIYPSKEKIQTKTWHQLKELALYFVSPETIGLRACYYTFTGDNSREFEVILSNLFDLSRQKALDYDVIYWLEGNLAMHPGLKVSFVDSCIP